MFLRPRMTRFGGHAGPYVWGGVTGVTDRDNPWLTAVQQNTATRLVVQAKSYDAEQRFLVNENPLSVRTALGVGFGTAGLAGPVFAPDKYGPAMWLDQQKGQTSYARALTAPTPTVANTWTLEVEWLGSHTAQSQIAYWTTGDVAINSSGVLFVWDGSSSRVATASLSSLLGVSSWEPVQIQLRFAGTSLLMRVREPGGSWVTAYNSTCAAHSPTTLTVGRHFQSATAGRGVWHYLTMFDGDDTDEKVAEFLPSMFVGGNRANGDTAVDAYGVTWVLARPSAGSDIPTDNTTRLSFDGTADYGQVIGDDTITSFVPATGLTVLLDAAFGSGAASGAVFASSANATTDDGIIISRNGANERIQGRVDDGTTVATVGDNADNITYDTRFQAAFAFGNSDHEAYVDGVSVETATDAVGSVAAAGPLRLGAEIDGSNKAAFDLYAFAVVGDDMSDTEVAATAAEGLAI